MEVHHIGYLVKDIEKSISSFEALGYQADNKYPPPFWDSVRMAYFCFMTNGNYCVELIAPVKESPLYPLYKQYKCAPYHMCYRCEKLDRAIEMLKKENFVLFLEPAPAPAIGENARVAFLMSARAGMIELVEES